MCIKSGNITSRLSYLSIPITTFATANWLRRPRQLMVTVG